MSSKSKKDKANDKVSFRNDKWSVNVLISLHF